MATHLTPDFKGPRRSGDHLTPDSGSPRGTRPRGAYPKDGAGVPDGPPQSKGTPRGHGDSMSPATPANAQVPPRTPRKTASDETRNLR